MVVFQRTSRIEAPIAEVWAFHSTIEGLLVVTPDWLRLRIHAIRHPIRAQETDHLARGTRLWLSIQPFGLGSPIHWMTRISYRVQGDRVAGFQDIMEEGPFRTWIHTHHFKAVQEATILTDRIEYELPIGPFRSLSIFAYPWLEFMFLDRHRRTRRQLE